MSEKILHPPLCKDVYSDIAGQSAGLLKKVRPAREVVEKMVSQAIAILSERIPKEIQVHA